MSLEYNYWGQVIFTFHLCRYFSWFLQLWNAGDRWKELKASLDLDYLVQTFLSWMQRVSLILHTLNADHYNNGVCFKENLVTASEITLARENYVHELLSTININST